jgi:dienelactone hydrolase
MKLPLLVLLSLFASAAIGQKKVIDHTNYNDWKSISKSIISNNGKYISFEINPHRGDGYLYIVNTETMKRDSFYRAKDAQFSNDETFAIFKISPPFDTLRNLELKKVDEKKWPKDTLVVYVLEKDSIMKFANIKSHRLNAELGIISYLETENKLPSDFAVKKKKCFLRKKSRNQEELESEGTVLRVWNPNSSDDFTMKNVVDYVLSEKTMKLAVVLDINDTNKLFVHDLETQTSHIVNDTFTAIQSIVFNELETKFAVLTSKDTLKQKNFELNLFDLKSNLLETIADSTSSIFPKGKSVSENGTLIFSEDDKHLYFGVADKPKPEVKDSLLSDEKPMLDIWHYNEKRLQTEQLYHLDEDLKNFDTYVYHIDSKQIIQLSDDTLTLQLDNEGQQNQFLATSDEAYALSSQWDISGKQDVYLINTENGSKKLIAKEIRYYAQPSIKGDYFIWYDFETKNYRGRNLMNDEEKCITCNENDATWDTDINGMPMDAYPEGFYGWSKDGNLAYLQSRHDLFAYNIEKNELTSITKNIGKKNEIELSPRKWDSDSSFVELSNLYFVGLDKKTKGTHVFRFDENNELIKVDYRDEKVVEIKKAKNADYLIFRSMTVSKYPDLELTNLNFDEPKRISTTNSNQSEFNWASVELVKWNSYQGLKLEGLLYKPENFDASKSYPMIVYFYEMYSDELHNYYSPKPTASIVFPTEYASAGYFMFIPDIRYKPGYPAQSAYDCIESGTDAMLKKYPQIDSTRMGLQGQSWGGYQTAQLITMTPRYRAAMAGAPVSNMFSAYGGIRWGSGINRQFQYEKTQSRIGQTIWEAPELYVENSPLFHLPKVKTPLLIMHNDGDGAVPWYQGIELFTGMRRLGKPCWLLNYNYDDHNLMINANRIDLSIRMRQFFDFYLNNQPSPRWLEEGIPALMKGKELRYENH